MRVALSVTSHALDRGPEYPSVNPENGGDVRAFFIDWPAPGATQTVAAPLGINYNSSKPAKYHRNRNIDE